MLLSTPQMLLNTLQMLLNMAHILLATTQMLLNMVHSLLIIAQMLLNTPQMLLNMAQILLYSTHIFSRYFTLHKKWDTFLSCFTYHDSYLTDHDSYLLEPPSWIIHTYLTTPLKHSYFAYHNKSYLIEHPKRIPFCTIPSWILVWKWTWELQIVQIWQNEWQN